MLIVIVSLLKFENCEKLPKGPISSNPEPVLLTDAKAAENVVIKSKLSNESIKAETNRTKIYVKEKINVLSIISSSTDLPPIFILLTELGCTVCRTSLITALNSIITRIIFSPPVVEPEQAPVIINMSKSILDNMGQMLVFIVAKPVVVITEVTWNAEFLMDSDMEKL